MHYVNSSTGKRQNVQSPSTTRCGNMSLKTVPPIPDTKRTPRATQQASKIRTRMAFDNLPPTGITSRGQENSPFPNDTNFEGV